MLHQNVDLYICEHCRLEFYDEEECLEHEKTHSPHFDGSTNEDIAKELDALGANACSFRVGDCVMGMTIHSFKNLMSVAARALRKGADNAGKKLVRQGTRRAVRPDRVGGRRGGHPGAPRAGAGN